MASVMIGLVGLIISAYAFYIIARGGFRGNDLAGFLTYIIIMALLIPFIPKHLPPPPLSAVNLLASVLGLWAGILKITYYLMGSLAPVIGEVMAPGTIGWVNMLANALIGIINTTYALLTVYTLAYYAWHYWFIAVIIGAIMAIRDGRAGFLVAFPILALSIIGAVITPLVGFLGSSPVPSLPSKAYITIITTDRPGALVITDQGFGFTPTALITGSPVSINGVVWLWLRMNYTVIPSNYSIGFIKYVVLDLEPSIEVINCGSSPCGAYVINGTASARAYPNGTIIITTNRPIGVWLWGSGYSVNNTRLVLRAGAGNEALNEVITGCNATTLNRQWLEPVGIHYYTSMLAQLPSTTVPSPTSVGYREYYILVNPGIARLGNETRQVTCLVRLYGVANNTWTTKAPIAYTSLVMNLINTYESLESATHTNTLTRLLVITYLLISVSVIGVITWDWWVNWIERIIGSL